MKVFVCHDHGDAKELAKIKQCLQGHGIDLFLAHADIDMGEHFPNRIKSEIQGCDFFLLIANEKSKNSFFCNQEVGFALASGRKILSYIENDEIPPWGLIRDTQGETYKNFDDLEKKLLKKLPPLKDSISSISLSERQPISGLVIMNLLGSWQESSEQDKSIVKELLDKDFSDWMEKLRESIRDPESPIEIINGTWKVKGKSRLAMWKAIGESIFDDHLDKFQPCAIKVLSELDPKFGRQSTEESFIAGLYNGTPNYSKNLKKGIAQTLALLGNKHEFLNHCSRDKAQSTVYFVITTVFQNAGWTLWASLNDVLPLLAEAAPKKFLTIVDETLRQDPCPFDDLFSQETSGLFGTTYISGLLWALEGLAWKEEYLSTVTVLLGKLASRDPGGNWANRPGNSLTTIFLPWFPQTMASWKKQKDVIKILQRETPSVAWKTLLSLLPNVHGMSSGCRKPWSYSVPERRIVSNKEYQNQVSFYKKSATKMAMEDEDRLIELIEYLDRLNPDCVNRLTKYIESHQMPKEKKFVLWERVIDFTSKHRKYAGQSWAVPIKYVSQIEAVADKIAPDDLKSRHSRLFNKESHELYEKRTDHEQQEKEVESRRQIAIKEILDEGGIDSVIQFAQNVKFPLYVGFYLGSFIDNKDAPSILKNYLNSERDSIANFIGGFVQAKHNKHGWEWVDNLNTEKWTKEQKSLFLRALPFNKETWKRAERWLENDKEYWTQVIVRPINLTKEEFQICAGKLLGCNRPISALDCLYWANYRKFPLPPQQSMKILLKAKSVQESNRRIDLDQATEIIKNLQSNSAVNPDDLFNVEWAYLDMLHIQTDFSPKTLEQKLASDPKFFHEMICCAFRPRNANREPIRLTEKQEAMSPNANRLLFYWKTPPGVQPDGKFSKAKFTSWLEEALKLCTESDRLGAAQSSIGKVLMYSPEDPNGLWIHRTIAEVLNRPDTETMRSSFSSNFFNSRGFHCIDPEGKSERELAAKYRDMADKVENEGFQRLCTTFRGLAEQYDRDAERHIDTAKEYRVDDE